MKSIDCLPVPHDHRDQERRPGGQSVCHIVTKHTTIHLKFPDGKSPKVLSWLPYSGFDCSSPQSNPSFLCNTAAFPHRLQIKMEIQRKQKYLFVDFL